MNAALGLDVPRRLYPLKAHPEQVRLVESTARFCVVPAGRRSGKTERAKRRLVGAAMTETAWDDARFFAGAPTRDQAKRIWWADLKAMSPRWFTADVLEGELTIRYINGAAISVVGMDKPQRVEGSPWNGGVLDEYGNMKPQAFWENVRPALSDRNGWCWLIGVPEGRNHYYDLWLLAKSGSDPEFDGFTWKSAEVLDPAEVAAAKRQLDPLTFQQEYEASFVSFEGRCYYTFDSVEHAPPGCVRYDPQAAIALCLDFNVDPGVAVVVQEQPLPACGMPDDLTGTGCVGEVHIPRNSNTPAVVRRFIQDWGEHQGWVYVYGDATGGARGTAQTEGSDWDIVKRMLKPHFGDRVVFKVPRENPAERARVNAVNSRLMATDGGVWMMVDPQACPQLVRDLDGVRLLKGGSGEIDKKATPELTHLTDALGYYVASEFPVREPRRARQRSMFG